ncbi:MULTISPECIES: hypothetical protein [unclassified Undibacterium]|uniref:hypothetical protein n=1 Tax=unclassified Undibacterium TaxID=2630295 RepID=UPI002AC8ABA7|nr:MULTISPECIES: hypothetical protein [unclassified Undibacterium]MEB0139523.1 hypothetical protein [Undibacterium sp. CCC2.1]MEB0172368.1 hypothetical protein [Undibacterium sp. CCC1.1]MEB0175695.1 hypothetical protein [Undibacterium sp. CCC3.4]MEB0214483.1 hypothetical protein [Undibacterium sp. 5I2]WPX42880.1 hypothetical protein RHM61_16055 [Undibacterium sp. CCC3.4]
MTQLEYEKVNGGIARVPDMFNQINLMSMPELQQWLQDETHATPLMRQNLAEDFVEEARFFHSDAKNFSLVLGLLRKAVLLAPAILTPYFYLWQFLEADQVAPTEIEHILRRVVRDDGQSQPRSIAYIEGLLNGVYSFLQQFNHADAVDQVSERAVLHLADDLSYEDIFYIDSLQQVHFLGRIDEPRLIYSSWQHSSLSPGAQTIAEEIMKRGKDNRIIHHCGTALTVTSRAIFGPAIDTLLLNQIIVHIVLKHAVFRAAVDTAVEIGPGSGFLMLTTARLLAGREGVRCFGFDIAPTACHHSRHASSLLTTELIAAGQIAPTISIVEDGAGLLRFADGEVDFLYTNPPYIPRPPSGERDVYGAIEGVSIYQELLLHAGPRVLNRQRGVALLLYSSLTNEVLQELLRSTPLCHELVGPELTVPLDLHEVLADPAWSADLRRNRGLIRNYTGDGKVRHHSLRVLALYWPENVLRQENGRIFS